MPKTNPLAASPKDTYIPEKASLSLLCAPLRGTFPLFSVIPGFLLFFTFFLFFFFFRATPKAYGNSQARGWNQSCSCWPTPATATQDPSGIFDLHHSSQQCGILNPLSQAGDQTHILMDSSWIAFCLATMGTPARLFLTELTLARFLVKPLAMDHWEVSLSSKRNIPQVSSLF